MKILFQYLFGGGGALSNVILLLRALAKQNPKDTIIVVCSPTSGLNVLQDLDNVEIVHFGGLVHPELDRLALGLWGLRKIAEDTAADVVWSLNLGSYLPIKKPCVLSVHNSHQVYPWEVTRYHPKNRLRVAILRWFFRRSLRQCDSVIVQTSIIRDLVRGINGSPNRISVIPKAVESFRDVPEEALPKHLNELFAPKEEHGWFNFLYVSTCAPHKNHKTLISAFSILSNMGIKARLIATVSSDELISLAGSKARDLIASGHIAPVGWVEKPQLKALYDACDACLMPSVLESLSSAHLEAMQWERPQVVADLPYAHDLCGDAALYASAESADDWVRQIKNLLENRELRSLLVVNGRKRMSNLPHSWDDVSSAVRAALEETVSSKFF